MAALLLLLLMLQCLSGSLELQVGRCSLTVLPASAARSLTVPAVPVPAAAAAASSSGSRHVVD
jgi:hypothetical protein